MNYYQEYGRAKAIAATAVLQNKFSGLWTHDDASIAIYSNTNPIFQIRCGYSEGFRASSRVRKINQDIARATKHILPRLLHAEMLQTHATWQLA
jgi:hypothetical protein